MVEAAAHGVAGIEASRIEIDRGGSSYTADTLAALRDLYDDPELFLIVGSDAAGGLMTWERVDEVRERVHRRGRRSPGRGGGAAAAGLALAGGRGAAARGVEHRPAGPGRPTAGRSTTSFLPA